VRSRSDLQQASDALCAVLGPGRLTPWFQPIVTTTTRSVTRFEALIRYERADGTLVLPFELLPALETAGQMPLLFPLVLAAALDGCRTWRAAGCPAGVAVNVTAADLRDLDLPGLVVRELAAAELPAHVLTVELSEQDLLRAGDVAENSLARLRSAGVRVAVDDFGAGHSSLARLADVAVSELKIDRGLVATAYGDPRRQIVLRAAVDLGHRLGLEVVAEGVEDEDVAGTVASVGADCIQGYLFGRPAPLDVVIERYAGTATEDVASRRPGRRRDPELRRPERTRSLERLTATFGRRMLAFVALNSVLYLLWLGLQPGGRDVGLWLGNLAYGPVTIVGIALCIAAGRQAGAGPEAASRRQGWYLLGAGMASYLTGDALQWLYEVVLERPAFPGPADIAFLAFYPLAMAGVLRFGRRLRDSRTSRTLLVDVLTVTIGAATIIAQLVLVPALPDGEALLPKVVAAAYPVGDLTLVFAISSVLMRGVASSMRLPLQLLGLSFLAFVLTDSVYVNMDVYTSLSFVNAGWIASMTLIALAAAAGHRGTAPSTDPAAARRDPRSVSRVPFVAVGGCYAMLLLNESDDAVYPDRILAVAAVTITALVALRQYVALRENRELTRAFDAITSSDELTGLSARRHFLAMAEREISLLDQSGGRATAGAALVLLDIDHFTEINQRHGHQAGDQVLTAVAEACRNQLRQGDLLGRYGGDEIIALLPHSTAEAAEAITGRIAEHLRTLRIETAAGYVATGITAAVTDVPAGSDLESALARLAAGLRKAKESALGSCTSVPTVAPGVPAQFTPSPESITVG
jgi:diguanylate cyclase (GGDEF)-like protein